MFKALEDKALELFVRTTNWLEDTLRNERGQTSGEYVAVTAVGVVIAIGILYTVLKGAINTAVGDIATKLTDFVQNAS